MPLRRPRAAIAPLALAVFLAAAGTVAARVALGQDLRMVDSRPTAGTAMDGTGREFWVRFNRPVDHERSRMMILSDGGQTVRTLRPRLDTAPEVLYAETPGLPPGFYTLRWEARPAPSGEVSTGTLDFAVR